MRPLFPKELALLEVAGGGLGGSSSGGPVGGVTPSGKSRAVFAMPPLESNPMPSRASSVASKA